MRDRNYPLIGEIYLMDFTGIGNEQQGRRPGIVFQNNVGNMHSPNIIALPITSAIKKTEQPTHVLLPASDTGLHKDSIALCESPQRMSKSRVGKYISKLPDSYMKQIAEANLLATSALAYLDEEAILRTWKAAALLVDTKTQT